VTELTDFVLSTSIPPDVGRITGEDDSHWTITWADGRVTTAKRGSNALRRVRDGSVALVFATDPTGFAAWFAAEPVQAFVAALKDEGGDAKGAAVQGRLVALGLPAAEVKAAWAKHKKALDRHPHVVAGSVRGALRWSAVAQDPLAWIDELPLLDAIKALAGEKVPPVERNRLEARVASAPEPEWQPSETLLGWAVGLRTSPPPTSDAAHIRLDERSLHRVLLKAEEESETHVLGLLARVPSSGKSVSAAFEQLASDQRWELGLEAVAALTETDVDAEREGACAILERVAQATDQVPWELTNACLRLRLGGRPLPAQVDVALEGFLTASLLPLERLRGELGSWEDLPAQGLARGRLELGSFRLRALTAVQGTRHDQVLGKPTTWVGLSIDAVEDLTARQHPLSDTLLAQPDSPGTAVVRAWLKAQPATSGTLGRVLGWSRRLREAVPRQELDLLVLAVRSSDTGVAELLEDPSVPVLRARQAELEEASAQALSSLTRERDELLERLTSLSQQLDWAHERMSGAVTDADRARASELRQAQIDAVRELCQVLDTVYEHDGPSRVVWSAALAKAAGIGVQVVGSVGELVDPEPRRFEVVDPPARGTCTVRRPGYEWISGEEQLVLLRALVSNR
jgi:hypothetical protein